MYSYSMRVRACMCMHTCVHSHTCKHTSIKACMHAHARIRTARGPRHCAAAALCGAPLEPQCWSHNAGASDAGAATLELHCAKEALWHGVPIYRVYSIHGTSCSVCHMFIHVVCTIYMGSSHGVPIYRVYSIHGTSCSVCHMFIHVVCTIYMGSSCSVYRIHV
jgi:hypothetical protein